LFEAMKAKLAGIASHVGMAGVFHLRGSDIYRILDIEAVPGETVPPPPQPSRLAALRTVSARLACAQDLESLLGETLDGLESAFDIRHAMVLMVDAPGARLYTLATRGYPDSGVGSEIPVGQGVIGVCAAMATPIRIGHATSDYAYGRTIRESAEKGGLADLLDTRIPLPGLAAPASQMAIPILARARLLGVLYTESPQELRFTYDDEDALMVVAAQLGAAVQDLEVRQELPEEQAAPEAAPPEPQEECASERPLVVRHYAEDDSIFLDGDYLIKGVAGSIFWALVRDHETHQRTAFNNKELRLDPRIKLPDLSDNLEARLVLLGRRLVERHACVRMEKTGRGRFRLCVGRALELVDVPHS
jgi:adenylate cyclase